MAAAVGLGPAAATTAMQRLVPRGHLTRQVDEGDRRRAVVGRTGPARLLIDRVYGADFLERGRRFQPAEAERIRAMAIDAGGSDQALP